MDIHTLASDKAFLAKLSTEYELLKRSGGNVNYDVWIRERLRSAAVGLQTGRGTSASSLPVWQGKELTNMPGAFDAAADTSTHLTPSAPSWAVAAKLQQSLQSSGAVSMMNATAERRRRLALAAAVALQQVQLGVDMPAAAGSVTAAASSIPAHAPMPEAADAVKAEVGRWMARLADQNQQLQAAVVGQQEQLQKQQALLQQVLEARRLAGAAGMDGVTSATTQTSSSGAAAAAPVPEPSRQQAVSGDITAVTAPAGPAQSSNLQEAIKSSWLVKSAFGHSAGTPPQPQQQQPTAVAAAPPGGSRAPATAHPGQPRSREQLKALLKELLLGSPGALQPVVQPQPGAAAGEGRHTHVDRRPASAAPGAAGSAGRSPRSVQAVEEAPRRSKAAASPSSRAAAAGGQARGWNDTPYTPPPPRMLKRKGVGHLAWVPPEPVAVRSPSSAAAVRGGQAKPKPGAPKRLVRSSSSGGSAGGGVEWHAVHVVRPSPQPRQRSPACSPQARSPGGASRVQAEWAEQEEARRLQKMQVLYSSMVSLAERLEQHLDLVRGAPPAKPSPGRSGRKGLTASGVGGRLAAAAAGAAGAAAAGVGEEGGREAAAEVQLVPTGMEDVLQQMLSHMEQLQQQEEEVRQRWFHTRDPPEAAAPEAAAAAEGTTGVAAEASRVLLKESPSGLGTTADPPPDAAGSAGVPESGGSTLAAPAHTGEQGSTCGAEPASSSTPGMGAAVVVSQQESGGAAEADYAVEQVAGEETGAEGSAAGAGAAAEDAPATPAAAEGWVPAITPELVAQVEAGRRRFLRHQQAHSQTLLGDLAAGLLVGEGRVAVQPLQLLEVVADALAEEVVEQQLAEVDGLCDMLCEQLLQAEFADA